MKKKILLSITFVLGISAGAFCQKLPDMYVPKKAGEDRIAQFVTGPDSKFEKLKAVLPNITASFVYSIGEIEKILDKIDEKEGLWVYLAAYNDCFPQVLPSSVKTNKIILLFSPGNHNKKADNEAFFFIDDKDGKDFVYQVRDTDCIQQWFKNYEKDAVQDILRSTLINKDPDNEYPKSSGKYYDTKSIFYKKNSLIEAITKEKSLPHILKATSLPASIDSLKFTIAAFDNDGLNPPDEDGHKWRNRMILNIDYMYKSTEFQFEDLIDYETRLNQTPPVNDLSKEKIKYLSIKEKLDILEKKGLDKGQLCPTHCP